MTKLPRGCPITEDGTITHIPSGEVVSVRLDYETRLIHFDSPTNAAAQAVRNGRWNELRGEQWLMVLAHRSKYFILLCSNNDDEAIIQLGEYDAPENAEHDATTLFESCQFVREQFIEPESLLIGNELVSSEEATQSFIYVHNKIDLDTRDEIRSRLPHVVRLSIEL